MKPALLPRDATVRRTLNRRAARAGLAILALGAAAACTKQDGRQPAVAPFATVPAPAENPAAPAQTYMGAHAAARDAALAQALVGVWWHKTMAHGIPSDTVTTFRGDGAYSAAVTAASAADSYTVAGTWRIDQGFLISTREGSAQLFSAEILRLDANQFVYVEGEDKLTRIAARQAGPGPMAAAQADGTLIADEDLFVAKDDVQVHVLRLSERAQLRLALELQERVPVTVVFHRGRVSPEDYTMGLGVLLLGQIFAPFNEGNGEKVATIDDLFANRLSKRAAYGGFSSPWVTVAAGTYTVILDNSGELSPSRGDAPARLRAYKRPVP